MENAETYRTNDARWAAVMAREEKANGAFYFAVITTGVFCLPSCKARPPLRENVSFYDTPLEAEKAGYRPCKRCKPTSPPLAERHAQIVAAACQMIDDSEEEPSLSVLARAAGVSGSYFNKLFKKVTGITPKQYATARRAAKVKDALAENSDVTSAIYGAGYGAASRFYEGAEARLGMKPSVYRSGGAGMEIRYSIAVSWLGPVLVAATEKGICSILFADDETDLLGDLQGRFSKATLEPAEPGSDFEKWLVKVLAFIEKPELGHALPLDIKGTAFQEQVWRALQKIPPGETASYSDVATAIGKPKAVRAVAGACAANPIALAIPCHRVLKNDGSLSGYRWGVDRKAKLLAAEKAEAGNGCP
jgi:AraC family transcriptional regulator of adaptative response/methylated-DNA-[protein]-cysteine methyltransferase